MLVCYLLGLALVYGILYRRSERIRSLLIVGYNYLFAMLLCFWIQLPPGSGVMDGLRILLICLFQAPGALTFSMDTDLLFLFQRPDAIIIFLMMSLYTVRVVLILFFQKALLRLRMSWRLRWAKDIYVVCGEEKDARALLEDIHRHVKRAAAVYLPYEESGQEQLLLPAFCADESFWDRLRPGRQYHVVLLPDACHGNMQRLNRLNEVGKRTEGLHVTAFLDPDLLRLEDVKLEHLDAFLTSRENLLIRSFMTANLPLAQLQKRGQGRMREGIYIPDAPFSLCVVGFGPLGREFLLSTYENTAFQTAVSHGRGLEALIIDENLTQTKHAFFRDFPHFSQEGGLTWLDCPFTDPCFFQAVEECAGTLNQILVDTGDTQRTIDTTMRLLRLFRKLGRGNHHPQMVVVLRDEADGSEALLSGEQDLIFQRADQLQFTYESLILRETDRQAEALHQRYQGSSLMTADWRKLGSFTQDSNRAAVWDIPMKLLLAGDLSQMTEEEREKALWQLARYEHRRWNAFHYARGWTELPAEELTEEERNRFVTKHMQERRHICLVDWDQLDDLPQAEPGILKRYDYENAAQLFRQ